MDRDQQIARLKEEARQRAASWYPEQPQDHVVREDPQYQSRAYKEFLKQKHVQYDKSR